MRVTRIYQPQPLITGRVINLSKMAAHHLQCVLRSTVGKNFILFNGEGGEYSAKISAINKNYVQVEVGQYYPVQRESSLNVVLCQAVLRSEKMDYVLQKAVELGVAQVIPLLTERCALKLSAERWDKRWLHWQAIMIAACEQSGRTKLPHIAKPQSFAQAIDHSKRGLGILLTPGAPRMIQQLVLSSLELTLLVGPEGGWSEQELALAQALGYQFIQLGPRVLRTETAGVVALTLLQGNFGDMVPTLV